MNELTRSWHDHQQPTPSLAWLNGERWNDPSHEPGNPVCICLECYQPERDISELENAEAFDRFMLRFNQEFDRQLAISSLDPIFEHFDRARSIAAMRDDLPTNGVYDPRM